MGWNYAALVDADEVWVATAHERMTENRRLYASLGFLETERGTDDGFGRVYLRKPVG
jgi:hypothetical protein